MAVRLGLGLARGKAGAAGLVILVIAAVFWFIDFTVLGMTLTAVGFVLAFERRRTAPSASQSS